MAGFAGCAIAASSSTIVAAGKVYRVAGVALDITALKRAQLDLQKTVDDLNRAKKAAEITNEQLSRANAMLAHLSHEDPLTGVGNRRFLEEYVEREWRRERRHHHEVALVMADVDHFKAYNDGYGHGGATGSASQGPGTNLLRVSPPLTSRAWAGTV